MKHTRQECQQPDPRGPANGSVWRVADAGTGDSQSRPRLGVDGQYELVLGEGNAETLALGDILVDVDGGPGGTGLVVWIMGG